MPARDLELSYCTALTNVWETPPTLSYAHSYFFLCDLFLKEPPIYIKQGHSTLFNVQYLTTYHTF